MLKSWGWEDYRLVIPYERNPLFSDLSGYPSIMKDTVIPNLTWSAIEASIRGNGNPVDALTLFNKYRTALRRADDMVDFLSDYVTVWTYTYPGSTPRVFAEEDGTAGSVIDRNMMQDASLDEKYGEYADRMSEYQAGGAELWAYVACEPQWDSPYPNILLFNDTTEARTMFWTSYELGQTGFLYWREDYYAAVANSTYAMRNPFSATGPGDGILVYPGAIYGQLDPIPSLRFVNMRDGIEDYDLLCMLETKYGREVALELAENVVTSTVTFTRDGDRVYNVHAKLLQMLEE